MPGFRAFRNLRIKVKLFLVIILLMILIIILAFGSIKYTYATYDKLLYDKSSRLLNLSSTTLDMELKRLETLSLSIIADSEVQKSLNELEKGIPEYVGFDIRKALEERLWTLVNPDERYIESCHLIDVTGKIAMSGNSGPIPEEKYKQIIQEAQSGQGAIRWIYPEESDPALILVREVRTHEPLQLKPIGTLIFRININRLAEDFAVGAEEETDIIMKAGENIVYPFRNISEATAEALQPSAPREGFVIKPINGEAAFISQAKSPYTGWTFYNVVPYNDIFETIIRLKNLMIALFLITACVVIVIGLAFARSLTKPIESLTRQMKEVQKSGVESFELDVDMPSGSQTDEVGMLQRTFRMMMLQIQSLIQENYSKQLMVKESELKALQAQINPHFLYNTLDSINWMARKNDQKDISSMVISLGFVLRSSISLRESIITIGEELDIIHHYIRIQGYRFRNRLDFRMEVPPSCRKSAIPKLTLQPLVENAVQYALEPMVGACTIRIYAEQTEEMLILVVEDNGPGMSMDLVEQLQKNHGEVKTRGTGIGLLNIRERIKLTFGEQYGIEVESGSGKGTRVKIFLPPSQEG